MAERRKVCSACRMDKPHSDYYIRTGTKIPQAKCKECFKAMVSLNYVRKPTVFDKLTEDNKEYVRDALKTHVPIKTMAALIGITPTTLSKYIKEGRFNVQDNKQQAKPEPSPESPESSPESPESPESSPESSPQPTPRAASQVRRELANERISLRVVYPNPQPTPKASNKPKFIRRTTIPVVKPVILSESDVSEASDGSYSESSESSDSSHSSESSKSSDSD